MYGGILKEKQTPILSSGTEGTSLTVLRLCHEPKDGTMEGRGGKPGGAGPWMLGYKVRIPDRHSRGYF